MLTCLGFSGEIHLYEVYRLTLQLSYITNCGLLGNKNAYNPIFCALEALYILIWGLSFESALTFNLFSRSSNSSSMTFVIVVGELGFDSPSVCFGFVLSELVSSCSSSSSKSISSDSSVASSVPSLMISLNWAPLSAN